MSSEKIEPNFDLLQEISKEGVYRLLYPPPQAGLAILEIYTKIKHGLIPNGRFREKDIYNALESSKSLRQQGEYTRLPQEKFNNIISDLQIYFLRYDADEQFYSLKDYADTFCKHAEETLIANFNPTHIEIICNALREKLQSCEGQDEIGQWIDTFFSAFKPKMKNQVDQLERQIDQSVKEIRATTQLENTSIIEILKSIDQKLDAIRKQNDELRSAFREMKSINHILEQQLTLVTNHNIGDQISEVRQFFPEIKYTLNLIDKRLDRIQPKLRQFFGMLNKPSFNVKVEKFLKYLLIRSVVAPNKNVVFPEGIGCFPVWQQTTNFTIVERRSDIFPATARPRLRLTETPAFKELGTAQTKQQLVMYSRVEVWINRIILDLKKRGEVTFSDYFFKVIAETGGDIELAAKVAYALIRQSVVDEKLTIKKTKDIVSKDIDSKLSIWEMIIKYQQ